MLVSKKRSVFGHAYSLLTKSTMANTSSSDLDSFVASSSKIRFSIHETASKLRRLGNKTTTPADVDKIPQKLSRNHHSLVVTNGIYGLDITRGILVIDKVPTDKIAKVMRKCRNLDVTNEKLVDIEIYYKAIISALKESGITDDQWCKDYIRQANERGFLMLDTCVQLEKPG